MNFLKYQNFISSSRGPDPSVIPINRQIPQNYAFHTDLSLQLQNIYSHSNDELWIESWLTQNNVKANPSCEKATTKPFPPIQIHDAKISLRDCLAILDKLNGAQIELQQNVEKMTSSAWRQKTVEIGVLKDEFTKLMSKFDNMDAVTFLKRTLDKRTKRRSNFKKRKEIQRRQHEEQLEVRKQRHKEIDQWLESMKEEVEKVRMEENMKKDADCVLSEVTKKKSDARKQLSLIAALLKLRTVREQMAVQRGEKTSLEDRQAFNIAAEKLIKMWENSLKVYTIEEQGLKLMLEKTAVEDSKAAQVAKERNLLAEWQSVLFGPKYVAPPDANTYWALTAAERDTETFIAIRKSWDTFLAPPDCESGSKIPIGWVLPDANTEKSWTSFLTP